MGEYADMIIEGATCACGEYIGEHVGYPRFCSTQCEKDYGGSEQIAAQTLPPVGKHVPCPDPTNGCGKKFRNRHAAAMHWIDKHE